MQEALRTRQAPGTDRPDAGSSAEGGARAVGEGWDAGVFDEVAREGQRVTRQTVHNLFGTRSGVLERLFDQIAQDGGMERMRDVMMSSDTEAMLDGFIAVFANFWARNRLLLKRIHGIAAIDPEFGDAIDARNQRRHMAATRVVERIGDGVRGQKIRDDWVPGSADLIRIFRCAGGVAGDRGSSGAAVAWTDQESAAQGLIEGPRFCELELDATGAVSWGPFKRN